MIPNTDRGYNITKYRPRVQYYQIPTEGTILPNTDRGYYDTEYRPRPIPAGDIQYLKLVLGISIPHIFPGYQII